MPWYDAITGSAFRDWVASIGGSNRIPQGRRLDPFATSMRNFTNATDWLRTIRNGNRPPARGGSGNQSETDLRSAGLLSDASNLSPLGTSVLAKWEDFQIADSLEVNELPRCLSLILEAERLGSDYYKSMINFWGEIRDTYPPMDVLDLPEAIYLVSYFNQSVNGYNPWEILRSARLPLIERGEINWTSLRNNLPNANETVIGALGSLEQRIRDSSTRASGRINFCRAIELTKLNALTARQALDRWSIPPEQADICLKILKCHSHGGGDMQVDSDLVEALELLNERNNVIFYGPPGTGKTHAALRFRTAWIEAYGRETVFTVTFHPSYSYEDFIEGFRPDTTDASKYRLQQGVFLLACQKAVDLQQEFAGGIPPKVLLIIDEINRGDVARIFGELITFIESDKRGISFILSQSPTTQLSIPRNLFILGTMNTADKSISLLDIALRRRFAFIEYAPNPSSFGEITDWASEIDGLRLGDFLTAINQSLLREGIDSDRTIGHAILRIARDSSNLKLQLKRRIMYDIVPLVAEYCYMERSTVKRVLNDLVTEDGRYNKLLTEDQVVDICKRMCASMPS
jgi:MoxR-like ATPase